MLRMLRFRRFRVFLGFAAVSLLLLLRYTHLVSWNDYLHGDSGSQFVPPTKQGSEQNGKPPLVAFNDYPKDAPKEGDLYITKSSVSSAPTVVAQTLPPTVSKTSSARAVLPTLPHVALPDRTRPVEIIEAEKDTVDDIHPVGPPGRQEHPVFSAAPTTIHWERQAEHFPVPTESLIHLPTGTPAKIPKIQFDFNDETTDAKINREKKQKRVRDEFLRAWNGYKNKAWLHDELSPVSGMFRDPFCGWAATLVDSLDTLWIMGLEEEFEEAARAVDLIDFTTSPRLDIPVFETTIRYLGGLLAAYDVSGGIYKNLLEKAVELAEVLMGAFDTPNRMPVLFYKWKPTFASQPHRANKRSNTAELGSLSMEFTRLAQLTKDPRYYDAVARITNALSEWQDRGTTLPGVFPDDIDASGCNRSAPFTPTLPMGQKADSPLSPAQNADPPNGYEPSSPKTVVEPRPDKKSYGGESLEVQIVPGEPSKARMKGWDDTHTANGMSRRKRDLEEIEVSNTTAAHVPTTRDASLVPESDSTKTPGTSAGVHPVSGRPLDPDEARAQLEKVLAEYCRPQGLDASTPGGRNKYGMGGGQDSTYEYFPKQYLLLNGREEKYRKMYLKTIDAVRDWMLFRPMLPDNRDILFSASVSTIGKPELDIILNAEVTHLTCFIGGMVGMSAKIFGIEGDLEIAKRLTDGCVWAYESTASGIMPEGATVLPCVSAESCSWNETAYWLALDPLGTDRDTMVDEYIQAQAEGEAEEAAAQKVIAKEAEEEKDAAGARTLMTPDEDIAKHEASAAKIHSDKQAEDIAAQYEKLAALLSSTRSTEAAPTKAPASLKKRQSSPREDLPMPVTHNFQDDVARAREGASSPQSNVAPQDKQYSQKALTTEAELTNLPAGRQAVSPVLAPSTTTKKKFIDPFQPLTHKEFVKSRIDREKLPTGYVTMSGTKYILRPEAIESVWYMYRITGDSTWQDKGWKMFEAIIKATSTEFGHSAIYDVNAEGAISHIDEMESFWLAETLKYFYLLYSTPDVVSLDEWVLNTEAHPFKREARV